MVSSLNFANALYMPLNINDTIRRYDDKFKPIKIGFGLDTDKNYLIRIDDEQQLHILPTDWIESVIYAQLRPAKGPGNISLILNYRVSGRHDIRSSHLNLFREPYVRGQHRELAVSLSKQLDVKLIEPEQYDC